MLRIKFFAMTLVVTLAGVVYAAGNYQDPAHQNHGAQSAERAACCKAGHKKDAQKDGQQAAVSCAKDGCCKGHQAGAQQASAMKSGAECESCCAGGCCTAGGGCCKGHQKAGAEATVVKTSADERAASCCGAGAECCKDGADCCKAHKATGQTAAADQKHEGGCACCGASCAMHTGR